MSLNRACLPARQLTAICHADGRIRKDFQKIFKAFRPGEYRILCQEGQDFGTAESFDRALPGSAMIEVGFVDGHNFKPRGKSRFERAIPRTGIDDKHMVSRTSLRLQSTDT